MTEVMNEETLPTPHINLEVQEESNIERPKHPGGRPKDKVWQHFEQINTKHPGHFEAKCKFCEQYWKVGIVKKLQVHLARECEYVSLEIKNKYMYIVAKRDGVDDNMEVETFEMNTRNKDDSELSAESAALIDRSILKAFVMCGIPFRVIENPYYVNMIKNLRSNYNPPSRDRLSTNLLQEESVRVEIKICNLLEGAKNLTLGIDGWSSPNNHSIYNFMITIEDNKEYLYSLRDLSEKSHTAKVLEDEIDRVLLKIGPKKFAAVVTDSQIMLVLW